LIRNATIAYQLQGGNLMKKINEIFITFKDNTKIDFCLNCDSKDLDKKVGDILTCMNKKAILNVDVIEDIGELKKNPLRSE
jgi:hypothetical protein